ncbi:MAG: 3,4-dehydroadipyl-CoA semialdehyde dehydrogenase [Acidobacteria bacterium]|nr:3,4-dehydroadipyl-CoA semialdehyde dehydrogenase [Acidobacteriota bacterium]
MVESSVPRLSSYVAGEWREGKGEEQTLVNPSSGEAVARCSTDGLDLGLALDFARNQAGPALRAMTFAARANVLAQIAEALAKRRERWYEIARINSGNTKADAAVDIDGSIGTLKYFAKLGAGLGNAKILVDAPASRLTRDPNFQAVHVGVPLRGVAVHINAYNFPAWGLWEKASVSLLSGVPVLTKPATATAWLAQEMVQCIAEAELLPKGSLSIICGSVQDLFHHLRMGDVICFTGSAATGQMIRNDPAVRSRGVRINVEADSLNATILGLDAEAGSQAFSSFVREVVQEMTVKAGQKCTAIRRIFVPVSQSHVVRDAIAAELQEIKVGDPANAEVRMGPLVNMPQRLTVAEGIARLRAECEVAYREDPLKIVDADVNRGAFVSPTLLYANRGNHSQLWNELEVFGPVATLIPYGDQGEAFSIAAQGGGSLVASVFSADPTFMTEAALALAASHGRVLLADPSIESSHTGHGIVLPSCLHGGPGRAGGGEELGGFRGLWFYHQRAVLQGSSAVLNKITEIAVNPPSAQS